MCARTTRKPQSKEETFNKIIHRNLKRDQLSNIIHAVLVKNTHLYYYQGFHDFVSVFLLTLGENLGFYCVEAASRFLIRDFMLESFDPGVIPAL